jgi:hypothetical protein
MRVEWNSKQLIEAAFEKDIVTYEENERDSVKRRGSERKKRQR